MGNMTIHQIVHYAMEDFATHVYRTLKAGMLFRFYEDDGGGSLYYPHVVGAYQIGSTEIIVANFVVGGALFCYQRTIPSNKKNEADFVAAFTSYLQERSFKDQTLVWEDRSDLKSQNADNTYGATAVTVMGMERISVRQLTNYLLHNAKNETAYCFFLGNVLGAEISKYKIMRVDLHDRAVFIATAIEGGSPFACEANDVSFTDTLIKYLRTQSESCLYVSSLFYNMIRTWEKSQATAKMDKETFMAYLQQHYSLSGEGWRFVDNILDYAANHFINDQSGDGLNFLWEMFNNTIGITKDELNQFSFEG